MASSLLEPKPIHSLVRGPLFPGAITQGILGSLGCLMCVAVCAAQPATQPAQEPLSQGSKLDPIEEGLKAARRGDFAEAYYLWRPLAEHGNKEAQYRLAWMYANGEGLRQDFTTAADWWELAAAQGHEDAGLALARAYRSGRGRDKDHAEAVHWLLFASRGGNDEAQAILRTMAADGSEAAVDAVERLLRNGGWEILGGRGEIARDDANLREKPNTSAKIVDSLKKGEQVVILSGQEKWLRIGVVGSGRLSWIYRPLVTDKRP